MRPQNRHAGRAPVRGKNQDAATFPFCHKILSLVPVLYADVKIMASPSPDFSGSVTRGRRLARTAVLA